MIVHYASTASCWITDHLQADSRKYAQASLEFAGLLVETRHDNQRRAYTWYLDGRQSTREAVEAAIDQRLNG